MAKIDIMHLLTNAAHNQCRVWYSQKRKMHYVEHKVYCNYSGEIITSYGVMIPIYSKNIRNVIILSKESFVSVGREVKIGVHNLFKSYEFFAFQVVEGLETRDLEPWYPTEQRLTYGRDDANPYDAKIQIKDKTVYAGRTKHAIMIADEKKSIPQIPAEVRQRIERLDCKTTTPEEDILYVLGGKN